jgi:hypothetical protein
MREEEIRELQRALESAVSKKESSVIYPETQQLTVM